MQNNAGPGEETCWFINHEVSLPGLVAVVAVVVVVVVVVVVEQ
jgi:hypothetical protein